MAVGQSDVPSRLVDGIIFSLFSANDIKSLSVKQIVNPDTFDSLNNPNPSGLYDSALGPFNRGDTCSTCKQQQPHCPGHLGHVQLPLFVYHPIFFKTLLQLLKACCRNCNRVLAQPWQLAVVQAQLKLASFGLLAEAGELGSYEASSENDTDHVTPVRDYLDSALEKAGVEASSEPPPTALNRHSVDFRRQLITDFFKQLKCSRCPHCSAPVRGLRQEQTTRIFAKPLSGKVAETWLSSQEWKDRKKKSAPVLDQNGEDIFDKGPSGKDEIFRAKQEWKDALDNLTSQALITPHEVREHLFEVWREDKLFLQQVFGALSLSRAPSNQRSPMDAFFIHVLPVAPSCFRPVSMERCVCVCVLFQWVVPWASNKDTKDACTGFIHNFVQN